MKRSATTLKGSAVFALIFIALGLVYGPALIGHYAHHDDYFAWQWNKGEGELYPQYLRLFYSGRFTGAVVQSFYFSSVEAVSDLNRLRILSLVYVTGCAFVCFLLLRKPLKNELNAFLFAVMMFTLPAFQITVAWASSVLVASAVFIAALAGLLAGRYFYLSIGLMIASIMMYQPAGMFFWVVAVLIFLNGSMEEAKPKAILFFKAGATGMLAYWVILWCLKGFLKDHPRLSGIYDPYVFGHPMDKLMWFLKEPFVNVLNLWNIFPTVEGTALTVGVLAGGYLVFVVRCFKDCKNTGFLKKMQESVFILLMAGGLILLSYAPNLMTNHQTPWYQCSVAFGPMVLIGLLVVVRYGTQFFPAKIRELGLTGILIAACLGGASLANANVAKHCVFADNRELEYLKAQLRQAELTKYRTITLILAENSIWAPYNRYYEFGSPSSSMSFHVVGIIRCALKEIGVSTSLAPHYGAAIKCEFFSPVLGKKSDHYYFIKFYGQSETMPVDNETLVIDMNEIRSWIPG